MYIFFVIGLFYVKGCNICQAVLLLVVPPPSICCIILVFVILMQNILN